MADAFNKNTVLGKTAMFVFEQLFAPISENAEKAAVAIEAFALGFAIQGLKMYIAIQPAIKAIKEFFGVSDDGKDLNDTMKKVGEYAAKLSVAFLYLGAVVLTPIVTTLGLVGGALLVVGSSLVKVGGFVYDVVHAFSELFDSLRVIKNLGGEAIGGFVKGIRGPQRGVPGENSLQM